MAPVTAFSTLCRKFAVEEAVLSCDALVVVSGGMEDCGMK
jgi:hypothetical protein